MSKINQTLNELNNFLKQGGEATKIEIERLKEIQKEIAGNKIRESNLFEPEAREFIAKCIHSHMGQWNENNYSSVILPKPQNPAEKYVHQCDYLASRKCLKFNFNITTY